MKNGLPGRMEAGVRMKNLMTAVANFQAKVVKVAQALFDNPAENWDDIVKVGSVILLHKKNYQTYLGQLPRSALAIDDESNVN